MIEHFREQLAQPGVDITQPVAVFYLVNKIEGDTTHTSMHKATVFEGKVVDLEKDLEFQEQSSRGYPRFNRTKVNDR